MTQKLHRFFNPRLLALVLVVLLASIVLHHRFALGQASAQALQPKTPTLSATGQAEMPPVKTGADGINGIARLLTLTTRIPERESHQIVQYTVAPGDSPWSIANEFNLQPESILWANPDLNSSAGSLKPGMVLNIPPIDGVIHRVVEGDTLEGMQALHGTAVQEIFEYPGNDFDLTKPANLESGQQVIVPNGTSPIAWQERGPNLGVVSSAGSSSIPLVKMGQGSSSGLLLHPSF